jgi:hypothetical protein
VTDDAAFAAVVGAQHQRDVFEGNDHRQAPEDQGNDAKQVGRVQREAVFRVENGFQRVQRAGTDITVHNAHGSQGQCRQAALLMRRGQYCTMMWL